MSKSFVHLHVHSAYSLLDGAIKIPDLVATAKSMGMPAVGLTDHGQMFGSYAFFKEAMDKGVKPIVGVEAYLTTRGRASRDKDERRYHLVLLSMNYEGYLNLCRMISVANTEGFYHKPRVDYELLERYGDGVIALSACLQGEIPRAITDQDYTEARAAIDRYARIFPDRFYLEIQENQIPEQRKVNDTLLAYSKEKGIPLVATNDCHYLKKEHYEAHDLLLCIQTKKTVRDTDRMRMPFNTYYFRSPEEMRELFHYCPEACDNTLAIAERCDLQFPNFPKVTRYHFPNLKLPEGTTPDARLAELSRTGLDAFFAKKEARGQALSEEEREKYLSRLEMELGVISRMGFSGYFLIVSDFTSWARSKGIPVGPGRGSAAGSLVSFATGITSIDPIRFDLLFERFLNPGRVSMPDIDTDFCTDGRAEVLDYVTRAYGGSEYVAQIATLGQLKPRMVIRDVGRALDIPLQDVDRIAKLVPDDDPKITLDKAMEREPLLAAEMKRNPQIQTLFERARVLEKLFRHASLHASGVVIGDRPLKDLLPLFVLQKQGKNASVATQFELNGVESMGLIKFDFLGLQTLTLIKHCLRLLADKGVHVDMDELDTSDPLTYELFRSGNLNGVFQMEKPGFRQYIMSMRPKCIEDITGLLAMYRPGPLKSGQADQYIKVKRGEARPSYPLPALKPILEETGGVILYQEQVMRIGQILAGFTLGEADEMRRAMGKKKKEEMDQLRPKFIGGCVAGGTPEAKAAEIFDMLEKFAEYGFNKSHSAAYAVVCFQTAWLKAHHPVEFMAALMTSEQQDHDKIADLMAECRATGIDVLLPDVSKSGEKFTVKDGKILFGLGAIKGVTQVPIEAIEEERRKKPFVDLFDFLERTVNRKMNRKVVEALINSGAMDTMGGAERGTMLATLDRAMKDAAKAVRTTDTRHTVNSLFGGGAVEPPRPAWIPAPPVPDSERLAAEKELLGFYVSGHPHARFENASKALGVRHISDVLKSRSRDKVRICGTIAEVKSKKDKNGNDFAFASLEDATSKIELLVWASVYQNVRPALLEKRLVVVEGRSEPQAEDSRFGSTKISVDDIWVMEEELDSRVQAVVISLPLAKAPELAEQLEKGELPGPDGKAPNFYLKIHVGSGEAIYRLDSPPKLSLPLIDDAVRILGAGSVSFSNFQNPFGNNAAAPDPEPRRRFQRRGMRQ
ncbi:MAG: DNA polymerase III subunit alpha [Deltaproteobacteria bacterium]|jgi:DNA polymerase-3 subunit alpha|nr:DNA polymerase III subunit alpha [Deltaproteobacteria bacterium]